MTAALQPDAEVVELNRVPIVGYVATVTARGEVIWLPVHPAAVPDDHVGTQTS